MNLDVSSWKEFRLGDLFPRIYKSFAYNKEDLEKAVFGDQGAIRYITRTDANNACEFLADARFLSKIEKANAITIGDTTATCFYQARPFITGDHMVVLRSDWLNELRGLFITTIIKREKYKYSYGRAYLKGKIAETMIPLPVVMEAGIPLLDDTHSYSVHGYVPDWTYMERFIENLHSRPVSTKVCNRKLPELDVSKWKDFSISSLFVVSTSKDPNLLNSNRGDTPYISSSSENNGLTAHVDTEASQPANSMTIARNGSVGSVFFQPVPYAASPDDVRILTPREKVRLNVYTALFIKTVMEKEKFKYAYGRKLGSRRIEKMIIKLPVTEDGCPDYDFMESYMRALPYSDRV